MPKPTLSLLSLTIALGALLVGSSALGADGAEEPKGPAKSPYDSGPPPVTDGYTDTTHGGTKRSGDAPIPPASKDGKVVTFPGHPEPEPPAAPTQTK